MRDAFVRRLTTLAEKDPRIFLITGDLGFGVLTNFREKFPDRYLNAGVAEQNMTGLATGLALEGRIVFTYSIGNFSTLRCLEQIRNDAAYHDANVKVVSVGGGFSYGALGISHHATEDVAVLRAMPGLTVLTPGSRREAADATEAAATTRGTCYLRLDKSFGDEQEGGGAPFVVGKARRFREGKDAAIVAMGGVLCEALAAADVLAAGGLHCRVLSIGTMKPLDREAILSACRETGGVVTVEEHVLEGGLGSAVAETCLDAGVSPKRAVRLGLGSEFCSVVGSQEYLRRRYGLDRTAIEAAVRDIVKEHEK
jgi:transketolase